MRRTLVRFAAVGSLALALMVAGFVGTAVAAKFDTRRSGALGEYRGSPAGISRATSDSERTDDERGGDAHSQTECPPPFTVSVGVLLLGENDGTSRCYDGTDTP
jgi:hypothetical protein